MTKQELLEENDDLRDLLTDLGEELGGQMSQELQDRISEFSDGDEYE
jgi:hypothetical protein